MRSPSTRRVARSAADIDARIAVQSGVVADLDRRIAQIDGVVEKATSKGRTGSAMQLADQQRKVRDDLVAQRTTKAKALGDLQVQKAGIDGERRMVEADHPARRGRAGRVALVYPGRRPAA